jgi:hypothetical protein
MNRFVLIVFAFFSVTATADLYSTISYRCKAYNGLGWVEIVFDNATRTASIGGLIPVELEKAEILYDTSADYPYPEAATHDRRSGLPVRLAFAPVKMTEGIVRMFGVSYIPIFGNVMRPALYMPFAAASGWPQPAFPVALSGVVTAFLDCEAVFKNLNAQNCSEPLAH